MNIVIQRISAAETYPVRHAELRKGRPLSSCAFEGDEQQSSIHLGAYAKDKLVGVASFMKAPFSEQAEVTAMQVRGMAVLTRFHRQGIGAQILDFGEQMLKEQQVSILWMNARILALDFYKNLGYSILGNEFHIPEVGAHFKMWKYLS